MTGRHRIAKWTLLISGLVIVAALAAWQQESYLCGLRDAEEDCARGQFKVLTYGYQKPWDTSYPQLLRNRYGVELEWAATCVVTHDIARYVGGYNSVSIERINAHFGKDVFAECANEARNGREH